MGIRPDQIVDYKALCGDSSDNIPGVKGVGHKTAVTLLKQFETLGQLYNSLDQVKGAVRTKLENDKDAALHSQYLAQIHLDVPLVENLDTFKLEGFQSEKLMPILEKLEFQSFLGQIEQFQTSLGGTLPIPEGRDEGVWFYSAAETAATQSERPPALEPMLVQTPEQLAVLVKLLQNCQDPTDPVAWDTETTGLSPRDAELVGIGCCWQSQLDAIAYIPVGHQVGEQLSLETVTDALRPILEDSTYPKVFQNAKFDRLVLRANGIDLQGVVFDTMLASYVIEPEQKHNLSDLSERYLGIRAKSYTETVPKGKTLADLSIPEVAQYCGLDAYTTFSLVGPLQVQLAKSPKLQMVFSQVEMPLEPILAQMETWGIRINTTDLHKLSLELAQDLLRIESQAHQLAQEPFNLGSPKQLSTLLFEKLGLDPKKSTKTKLGYSTNAATLEKLQGEHPIIDLILEHRTLSKLKSTYVDALPALVRCDTHRIHTDFNQAVTATGRLSSSNPNLQNIPIRTDFSRRIRSAFIPQETWILAAADYSQIELRILAHLSQEERLLSTFRNGEDVHTLTAQLLLEKDEISLQERRLGKIINFGVIYGMGAHRFAGEAGVSFGEAKEFIRRFYERYPGVFAYLQRMEQEAVRQGYVETILGRRRYFQFETSALKRMKGESLEAIAAQDLNQLKISNYDRSLLRAAANAPIQGSSADLIKTAMVNLQPLLDPESVHLLIQVHDELVFEIHPQQLESVLPKIQATMESAMALSVPLVVDVKTGKNWMQAK